MSLGVAMVASVFPPSIGGIQNQAWQLSRKLAERGVRVHVLTRALASRPAFEEVDGVSIHRLGLRREGGGLPSAAFIAHAVARLGRLRGEVQVVHAHQLLSPATVALAGRRLWGIPCVLNPHACGDWGDVAYLRRRGRVGRARLEDAARNASAFVGISGPIRNELIAAGISPDRIWSIPNGVDLQAFQPASSAEQAEARARLGLSRGRWVLFSGRLAREKGVDVLLEAWPRVARLRPDAKLAIVGDGEETGALRGRAEALGLGEAVRFAGAVSDVRPWLAAADAAVLPSRTEGMPVALLEAMACGLPAAATLVGGTPEVMVDGMTGRGAPPETPDALANALAEALDPAVGAVWGRNARRHAELHFSLSTVVERLLELYAHASEERRHG